MASRKASLPPGANPSWSARTRAECDLVLQMRPAGQGSGVPAPSDDEELEEPQPVQGAGVRTRSERRQRSIRALRQSEWRGMAELMWRKDLKRT